MHCCGPLQETRRVVPGDVFRDPLSLIGQSGRFTKQARYFGRKSIVSKVLMATQSQIEETYNYMDQVFRVAYGEDADVSGAMFNGDFSLSLEQAQDAKHQYILTHLGVRPDDRVLDIGCGWGPMLRTLQQHGATGLGITLSTKQAEACRRNGLDAHVSDWKHMDVATLGTFDAIAGVGSLEAFCSKEEFLAGKQNEIYTRFFAFCHHLLRPGGRLFIQTMTWGKNAPALNDISLNADKNSNEYVVALTEKFYPGCWLPSGENQIIECASPYFKVVSSNSGRLDYMETIRRWNTRLRLNFSILIAMLRTLRYFLIDRNFRFKLMSLVKGCQYECFKREIMDHHRMVFERIGAGDD
jgi:cyclopropane-fatty-acyl-phospholipid synthase